MDDADRFKLKEIVDELGKYKGRHTELISVYVPAGYNLNLINTQLETEKGTASNIKSKNTRKNVLDALERILRNFKLYKGTPEKGIAIFCGNIAAQEGVQDIKLWAIEPPFPLKVKVYRCDQEFLLDPIKEMLEATEVYGLIVIERKEATLGLLEGKMIKILKKMTSGVPGKVRAGGQSAARFSRITESLAKEFYKRVAESAKIEFFEMKKLKGILLGGPGPTKEDFLKEGELPTALKEKVIAIKDIGYADEFGLQMLVEASTDVLSQQEITKEKQLLQSFFLMLATKKEKVSYGFEEVKKALEVGAAEKIIISSVLKKEQINELIELAKNTGASLEMVSDETGEGLEFKNLGGVGAFLRFQFQF
ncbi:peptide chain release factor 1 [Candidatus Pacearchaeota archaeon CG06_land_8_20_14_3_00_35_12]|nr:MAG: peptide chain release factor 1 [Candidatus Pacearchaeota archaeon CG06_land_8_20_14_3_00_35_12]